MVDSESERQAEAEIILVLHDADRGRRGNIRWRTVRHIRSEGVNVGKLERDAFRDCEGKSRRGMGGRYDRRNCQQLITGKRLIGDLATGTQHQLRQGAILNADRKNVFITVGLRDVQCDISAGIRFKSDP